jgi:hypothetical protein
MSGTNTLRSTPRYDRSDVGRRWTMEHRYSVVDLFCGRGGVGNALAGGDLPLESWTFAGFDWEDYADTYPGDFVQADLLDDPDVVSLSEGTQCSKRFSGGMTVPSTIVEDEHGLPTLCGLTADVVWVSFPCIAYSSLTPCNYADAEDPQQAALDDNPRITDEFREFLLNLAPHYVIENVPRATKLGDLDANARVNGLAFQPPSAPAEEKYNLTRHFETTFPLPDAYREPEADEEYTTVDTRDDQSIQDLAAAKNVPASWGRQGVRSAIPQEYVEWVLHFCPSVPSPAPERFHRYFGSQSPNPLGMKA